jgi:hypothetical protein
VIKQEYVAKANDANAADPKKTAPKHITTKHTVAMKHMEQFTDAATVSVGQNKKPVEIVECLDEDFSDEELLIVANDNDLKLNVSEPTKVQHLETEARPLHVARNPPVIFSIGPEVHSTHNGVAVEWQEAIEESVVAVSLAEKQQDVFVEREDTVLSDALISTLQVMPSSDSS